VGEERMAMRKQEEGEKEGERGEGNARVFSHSALFLSCFDPPRLVVFFRSQGTSKEDAFQPFMRDLKRVQVRDAKQRGKRGNVPLQPVLRLFLRESTTVRLD
jgi:hypothetical protein